jgi:hypothetical protein
MQTDINKNSGLSAKKVSKKIISTNKTQKIMSKTLWRFKLMEDENDNTPVKWIDCDVFNELKQVSLVIDGKKTLDDHLSICAVGNHIQFASESDIYKIVKVISQNGEVTTTIDTTCVKVK